MIEFNFLLVHMSLELWQKVTLRSSPEPYIKYSNILKKGSFIIVNFKVRIFHFLKYSDKGGRRIAYNYIFKKQN